MPSHRLGNSPTRPSAINRPPDTHCHTSAGIPISAVEAFKTMVNRKIDAPNDAVISSARRSAMERVDVRSRTATATPDPPALAG